MGRIAPDDHMIRRCLLHPSFEGCDQQILCNTDRVTRKSPNSLNSRQSKLPRCSAGGTPALRLFYFAICCVLIATADQEVLAQLGSPIAVPGRIEAENYGTNGSGIS